MISLTLADIQKLIPDYVINIAEELQKHNYEAYLVGGTLRDVLLGKVPEDYDIATNAYPEEIEKIFPKSIPTGAKFGTITVVTEVASGERFDVEVTTYRSEADYMGGRWPAKVEFTKTIDQDLARRDFTINALALNLQNFDEIAPTAEFHTILIDLFGGLADLEAKTIRAVGNAFDRFTEDGLRPMRACRLASQLEFEIEPETFDAIKQTNHITQMVSMERLRDEFMKLLVKSPKPSKGLRLLKDCGILQIIIPELLEGVAVQQPQFHVHDVFTHLLATVDAAEDDIKLAALFHDIAKPRCFSKDEKGVHFYGHDVMGAEMTEQIMRRMKFSNDETERTSRLVRWHMFYYPSISWREQTGGERKYRSTTSAELQQEIEQTRYGTNAGGWSDGAIRRLIINVGGEEAIDQLMKLRIADASANPKSEFNPEELDVLAKRIADVRSKDMALKITDLNITGHDLMETFKLEPGPKIGEVMKHLLELVLDDPALNDRAELIKLAGTYLQQLGG